MSVFDAHVARVAEYVSEMRGKGRPATEITVPSSVRGLEDGLPIRVGPGANPRIILRGDTFVELGSPEAGSCGFVLWTDRPSLVRDGKITLLGPDIPEAPGTSLPFGQVLLVGGEALCSEDHQSVGQTQYVADQIEGYMLRSSSRSVWARVSKDAAARGFRFETLGRSLMMIFKSSLPKVNAMEIVFVTSGKGDLLPLDEIAREAHAIGDEIVREHWKARGYDLDCDLHCGSCTEKDVCDDLRKMVAARLRKAKKDGVSRTARASSKTRRQGAAPRRRTVG